MRTCLDRLEAGGIIRPCDPDIVAARIKRAGPRPPGWDLDLSLIRGDLTEAGIAALGHQFPGLCARVAAAARRDAGDAADGCNRRTPHELWITGLTAQPPHPASEPRCNQRTGRVQPAQPRGAAAAPEPSMEPTREPSAASARGREALPAADGAAGGGGRAGKFFHALGPVWRLTAAQRSRLTPAVLAALDEGWSSAVTISGH